MLMLLILRLHKVSVLFVINKQVLCEKKKVLRTIPRKFVAALANTSKQWSDFARGCKGPRFFLTTLLDSLLSS